MSKIGSILGIPINTDKYTEDKSMLQYTGLLIHVSLDGPFPVYVEFTNDFDLVVRQLGKYEWKPIKCHNCQIFGYVEDDCRRKNTDKERMEGGN